MLTRWILENFKPIRDRVDLPLAPLTVLAGLNSSGKSSLLQSILLVAQTLSNQRVDEPLVLNGHFVRLGTFQDACNDRAKEKRITIGFTLLEGRVKESNGQPAALEEGVLPAASGMTVDFEGVDKTEAEVAGISAGRVDVRRIEMTVSVRETNQDRKTRGLRTTRLIAERATPEEEADILQGIAEPSLRSLPRPPGQNYLATVDDQDWLPGAAKGFLGLSHFVPNRYIVRIYGPLASVRQAALLFLQRLLRPGPVTEDVPMTIRTLLSLYWRIRRGAPEQTTQQLPEDVRHSIHDLAAALSLPPLKGSTTETLVSWLSEIPQERTADPAIFTRLTDTLMPIEPSELEAILGDALASPVGVPLKRASQSILYTFTSTIRYLGPLRAEPHAIQSFSPTGQLDDVGPRGEYAAAVYAANRKHPVRYFDPVTQQIETRPLEAAMDVWLRYLGVADHVGTREAAVPGVSWLVRSAPAERERPLGAVGVGVSQVLPILVSGLLAPEGSILIMEQPELHLHERPQARLGDFFYGLTRTGKQVLVETHSSVLIGQLRYHMVQRGQEARDAIAIYFVTQDADGQARFDPIRISRRGAIENWPDGFFDESFRQEDRITQEGLRKSAGR